MKKKALTLMEIIVSLTILSVVMAGLLNFFISAKKHTTYSRSRVAASELGRLFLDPLQMQVGQDTWASSCLGSGSGCADPKCATECANNQTVNNMQFTPNYTIDNVIGTTLRRVTVNITWSEH